MNQRIWNGTPADIDTAGLPEWLVNEAAARIRDGSLPNQVPPTTLAGPSPKQSCAVCDYIVEADELAYQITSREDGPLHFHVSCFKAWENAVRSMPRIPGWAAGVCVERPQLVD